MHRDLPGVKYTRGITNPTVEGVNACYELPFEKDEEYFKVLENFVSFVKAVEKIFRSSNQYKRYVSHIKKDVGLKRCQIHGNIEETEEKGEKLSLEMHHGPILTLFDIVSIVLDDQLKRGNRVTTFGIADLVAEAHFDDYIQVVMLCKTCHELVHTREILLHYNQAYGNLPEFLKKYKNGLTPELYNKIRNYIEMCKENDCFTNEILEVEKTIGRWSHKFDEITFDE